MIYLFLISITLGIAVGTAIVILIQIQRRAEVINSMGSLENAVGLWGTVEVPFDLHSRGKVRVVIKGSTLDLLAITDAPGDRNLGDRVFVIAAKENRILVVPEDQMQVESKQAK
jgi:predicted ribosome-associated RNA-binding protein Tma20